MPKLGEAFVELRADMGPLVRGYAEAHGLTMRSASSMGAGFSSSFAGALRLLAPAIGAATVGGVVALAVKEYAKLERGFAMVHTVLSKEDEHFLAGMKERIQSLATQYGQSTETISKALFDIISSAMPAAQATDVLEVAMRAAVGGFTQTATAAKAIVSVLNAYNQSADQAATVSDIMFAGVNRGVFTYEELADSIGDVVSMASLAGISFQELMANLATITRQGVKLNEATHAYGMLLQAIIDPQDDASQKMRELGVDTSLLRVQQEGLLPVLRDIQNLSVQDLNILAGRIRGFRAIASLVKDQAGRERDLAEMFGAGGAAQEAYGKVSETTSQRLERLRERVHQLIVAIGERAVAAFERLESAVKPVSRALRDMVDNEAFAKIKTVLSDLSSAGGAGLDQLVSRLQETAVLMPAVFARIALEMKGLWQAVQRHGSEFSKNFFGKLKAEAVAVGALMAEVLTAAGTRFINEIKYQASFMPVFRDLIPVEDTLALLSELQKPIDLSGSLERYGAYRAALLEEAGLGGEFRKQMERAYPLTAPGAMAAARGENITAGQAALRELERQRAAQRAMELAVARGESDPVSELRKENARRRIVGPPQPVAPPAPSDAQRSAMERSARAVAKLMDEAFSGAELSLGSRGGTPGLFRFGVSLSGAGSKAERLLADVAKNTRDTYLELHTKKGGLAIGS